MDIETPKLPELPNPLEQLEQLPGNLGLDITKKMVEVTTRWIELLVKHDADNFECNQLDDQFREFVDAAQSKPREQVIRHCLPNSMRSHKVAGQ